MSEAGLVHTDDNICNGLGESRAHLLGGSHAVLPPCHLRVPHAQAMSDMNMSPNSVFTSALYVFSIFTGWKLYILLISYTQCAVTHPYVLKRLD